MTVLAIPVSFFLVASAVIAALSPVSRRLFAAMMVMALSGCILLLLLVSWQLGLLGFGAFLAIVAAAAVAHSLDPAVFGIHSRRYRDHGRKRLVQAGWGPVTIVLSLLCLFVSGLLLLSFFAVHGAPSGSVSVSNGWTVLFAALAALALGGVGILFFVESQEERVHLHKERRLQDLAERNRKRRQDRQSAHVRREGRRGGAS